MYLPVDCRLESWSVVLRHGSLNSSLVTVRGFPSLAKIRTDVYLQQHLLAWCSLWTPSSVLFLQRSLCLFRRGKGEGRGQLALGGFVFWVLASALSSAPRSFQDFTGAG